MLDITPERARQLSDADREKLIVDAREAVLNANVDPYALSPEEHAEVHAIHLLAQEAMIAANVELTVGSRNN